MITINPKLSVLGGIVDGYNDIEPCIVAALALRQNIFLEGKHGIGKTTLGQILGKAMDETGRGFRYYAADKANLITIGGLPDMERSSKTGKLQFMETDQSIFGAKVVLVDELPRADKERQNYWLEITESRTFNGLPCNYDMMIATGNLSTYKGNFNLDLALKSRFLYWLPAPSFDTVESSDVIRMIRLNMGTRDSLDDVAKRVRDVIGDIRQRYDAMLQNSNLIEQVATWIGTYTQFLKAKIAGNAELCKNGEAYIPPREFAVHMVKSILGLKAYFDSIGMTKDSLRMAGQYTVRYVIETRHAAAGVEFTNICQMAWRQLSGMLVGEVDTPKGKLQYKFASSISAPSKIAFWRDNLAEATTELDDADITTMAGDTMQQIRSESIGLIGPFWHIMKSQPKTGHLANEVEGFMITEVARKLLDGKYFPQNKNGQLWSKYQDATTLYPEQVAEVLGSQE